MMIKVKITIHKYVVIFYGLVENFKTKQCVTLQFNLSKILSEMLIIGS